MAATLIHPGAIGQAARTNASGRLPDRRDMPKMRTDERRWYVAANREMNAMSTKITKGLAAIALITALGGGLASCGNSVGTAPAPKSSASSTAPAPAPAKANPGQDMTAWAAAGGTDALNSIGRCMSAMGGSPTPKQMGMLSAALAKAESHPMPSSVDPRGAYIAMLEHLKKVITAYENGDVVTALSESGSMAANMKTLQDEMKAAGFDVSS